MGFHQHTTSPLPEQPQPCFYFFQKIWVSNERFQTLEFCFLSTTPLNPTYTPSAIIRDIHTKPYFLWVTFFLFQQCISRAFHRNQTHNEYNLKRATYKKIHFCNKLHWKSLTLHGINVFWLAHTVDVFLKITVILKSRFCYQQQVT